MSSFGKRTTGGMSRYSKRAKGPIRRLSFKKTARPAYRSSGLRKSLSTPFFNAKRNCTLDFMYAYPEGGSAPSTGFAYQFQLNQLPNYQEFTALFDAYRINCVVLRMTPMNTVFKGNTDANNENTPTVYAAIDYNNADSPTSADEMKQYANVLVFPMYQSRNFKIRPRLAIPVYRPGATAAYIQQPKQWIDCNYADVPHYGLRVWVEAGQARNAFRTTIECTYYMTFRNLK